MATGRNGPSSATSNALVDADMAYIAYNKPSITRDARQHYAQLGRGALVFDFTQPATQWVVVSYKTVEAPPDVDPVGGWWNLPALAALVATYDPRTSCIALFCGHPHDPTDASLRWYRVQLPATIPTA